MIINFGVLGGGGGGEYHLPTATASRLGGVKIGSGVTVSNDGTISVEGGGGSAETYTIELTGYNPQEFTDEDIQAMEDMCDYLDQFDLTDKPAARIYADGCYYTLSAMELGEESGETVVDVYIFTHADTIGDYNDETGEVTDTNLNVGSFRIFPGHVEDSFEAYVGSDGLQAKFTVGSEEAGDNIAASEGDICTVNEHWEDAPETFYAYLSWGNSLYDSLNAIHNEGFNTIRMTLVESEYFEAGEEAPVGGEFYWSPGCIMSENYGVRVYQDTPESDIEWQFKYEDGSWGGVIDLGGNIELPIDHLDCFNYNNAEAMIVWSGNTTYQYGLKVEVLHPQKTYQYNESDWIRLADVKGVNEAKDMAQQALNTAANKFDYGYAYLYNPGDDPRQQLEHSPSGAFNVMEDDQQGQWIEHGLMLHTNGTTDEANNKYLRELVVSQAVSKIVALTQQEYDNLSTYDNTVLYVIIPDNS